MKKAAVVLFVAMILVFLVGCSNSSPAGQEPEETPATGEGIVAEATEPPVEEALTEIAEFDDMSLGLRDCSITEGDDGLEYLVIEAVYKNDQADPYYALCSFVVKAFQEDVELEDCSDINGADADLIKEVRNGEEITVTYRFALNGRSDVEVLICEPTANEATLARKSYSLEG